ncbi:hypothetical protein [Kurthia sibirica]|uniref:Uncharacterized protein n=1 Tax=Kurthia sibirica TaxID=202750 RepID=A0A2U3AN47_9BACL|nr:hypothetical protein [Kurthia sibirica]PWI25964.1 hypothetical protein DEX24_05380 [Kurthia sibirica]GEK35004.1 hypothetical protein KSI01_25370 [Kurthia sibirica]
MKKFRCPVCGYKGLTRRPYDYSMRGSDEICNCCGTQHQFTRSTAALEQQRATWMIKGNPIFKSSLYPAHYMDEHGQITKTQLIRQFNAIGMNAEICLEDVLMISSP